MKVRLTSLIFGADGKTPLINPETNGELTLKDIIVSSLLAPDQEEAVTKLEKYDIFKAVRDAEEEVNLTIEQVVVLKKCIGKFQYQLVMGQCFELLEN